MFRRSILLSVAVALILSASCASAGNDKAHEDKTEEKEATSTRGRPITKEEVKDLCWMKKVELSSMSHIQDVFNGLGSELRVCRRRVETAIIELNDIVNEDKEDVCTQKKADAVADWFKNYGIFTTNPLLEIPKPLRTFFYAYGLLMAEACRKNMLEHLVEDSHNLLTVEDFEVFNKWTNDQSFLSRIIKDPKDFDDLLLPAKLGKVLKKPEDGDKKIYIETPTAGEIKKIQSHCEKRFKPFYSKLILPLITLSESKFNHKGETVERDMALGREIYQWYRVVYMCESLTDIEIIENPPKPDAEEQHQNAISGSDSDETPSPSPKRRVRMLSKEEADELKRTVPQQDDNLEMIEYEPNKVQLPEVVLDWNNKELSDTLKSLTWQFPINDMLDLMEPKPMRKMIRFMQGKMRKAPIYIASKLSGMKGTTSEKRFNDQMLVKFIDDYANQLETRGKPKSGLFTEIKWLWELNKVKIITGILMVSYIVLSTTFFQTVVVG